VTENIDLAAIQESRGALRHFPDALIYVRTAVASEQRGGETRCGRRMP